MAYSVTNLKNDVIGVLHGTTANQIQGFDNLIYRAARTVLMDIDPQETIRILPFVNPIFNSVWDYAAPADLKGNRIIDIRPQVARQLRDIWLQKYNQAFDVTKILSNQDSFTINFNTAIKTVRINAPNLLPGIVLNQATGITDNGTWAVGGGATNLTDDNVNFVAVPGSLKFDLSAAASPGWLENSTMSAQDLSNELNQGTLFLYTFLPTASDFSAVELRWGSSAADYYAVSTSVTQQNTAFQNGWNLLAFNWLGATVVGAPNPAAIDYVRVTWTYNGTAQTAVRLNNIVARLGTILEVEYYSKFLFRDALTGVFQETITDDSNLVNLDTESYNVLFYQAAMLAFQQQQGINATRFDFPFTQAGYIDVVRKYNGMYPSQVQKPQSRYYRPVPGGYSKWMNWRN